LQGNEFIAGANLITDATVSGSLHYRAGVWNIMPGGANGGTFNPNNYEIVYLPGILTVLPKDPGVAGIVALNKVYDGTIVAPLNTTNATLTGTFFGDAVALNPTAAVGFFANKNVGNLKFVTITNLALIGADAANYAIPGALVTTANITRKTVTLSGVDAMDKLYNGTAAAQLTSLANANLSGVVFGDLVGLDTESDYEAEFNNANVGANKPVTVSGLALIGLDAGNYNLLQPVVLYATIFPRALAITANDQTKVYGNTTLGNSAFTSLGLQHGETVGTVTLQTDATLSGANRFNVGAWAIDPTNAAGGTFNPNNYLISYINGTLTVTPKNAGVDGITANNKVYDGTTAASINAGGASLTGILNGDVVILNATGATGVFDNKNVGDDKVITISNSSLSGADSGNYDFNVPVTTTADITPKALILSGITALDRPYDGTNVADLSDLSAANLTGVVAPDDVSVDIDSDYLATFNNASVGTNKPVTVTGLALDGVDEGNYTLTQPTGLTADITGRLLIISGITADDKVYDRTTSAIINVGGAYLIGLVAGDDVSVNASGATAAFDDKNVGADKTVTISGLSLSGADADSYEFESQVATTADITPKALTVSGITANDKQYDGNNEATLSGLGSALVTGVINPDVVSVDPDSDYTATFNNANVGIDKPVTVSGIELTGADAGNYTVSPLTGLTADITLIGLTITANDQTKTYGNSVLGTTEFTAIGLQEGDTIGSVTLTTNAPRSGSNNIIVGSSWVITPSAATGGAFNASNYTITYVTGTLTVNPKSISAKVNDKVYDGTTAATINGAVPPVGLISGDTVTLNVSGATATFSDKNVGEDKIVTVSSGSLSGADAGNYFDSAP